MGANEIIEKIQKLPFTEKMYVIEKSISLIRKQELQNQMQLAAEALYEDYASDKELTAFTQLDLEDFYEAR